MTSYKIVYFPVRGRGEILRLTLTAAGQQYEEELITGESWPALKDTVPMKQLPAFVVTQNGQSTTYSQSGSSARYLAKKHGLMGSTPEEEYLIDEAQESVMDIMIEMFRIVFEKDENAKKEGTKKLSEEGIPKLAEYFSQRSKSFGKNGFMIGSKLTLADLSIFNVVDQSTRIGYGDAWKKFPEIAAHKTLVESQKTIADYLAKRPVYDI